MIRLVTAALLAAALAGNSVAAEGEFRTRLDIVIDRAIARELIVGAVVLVAEDGEIVYQRAAGVIDREAPRRRAMPADAVFRFASMTKPIVSVVALALMEQGRLGLDDPVRRWLPDFRPRLADGREPVITVRHLLTHTAGLSYGLAQPADGPYHRAGVSDGLDQPGLSAAENLERLASVPLFYEPGTQWGYSLATDVLGEVVAKAAGAPLPDLVERLVTGPLGMHDTGFAVLDPEQLAIPYADAEPRPQRMGEPHQVALFGGVIRYSPARALNSRSYPSGGAGMVGTAADFLTFLEALRTGGEPVLRPETVALLTTDAIAQLPAGPQPGWGWGLGFSILRDPLAAGTPQAAGSWAWGGAYGSAWFVDPERRLTVVVMTNTAVAGKVGAFPDAVRDAIYAD